MLALTKIKKDIEFNNDFKKALEVLKLIAAAQFYALEKNLKATTHTEGTSHKPFTRFEGSVKELLDTLLAIPFKHAFLEPAAETKPRLFLCMTSDRGLLGGLNMRVVRAAIDRVRSAEDELVVVGEQGKNYARDSGIRFTLFPGIQDDRLHEQTDRLAHHLFKEVKSGRFGAIETVYPRALSLVSQRLEIIPLFPPSREGIEPLSKEKRASLILESSPASLLEYLVYLSLVDRLTNIFLMSRLAEAAARYTHLEECMQKIDEINKKLKLKYFRLRHEVIDASMRELFSARIVYAE